MATRQTHEQGRGNQGRSGQASHSSGERPRDAEGRFIDEDDRGSGTMRSNSSGDGRSVDERLRDAQGRFTDDDDSARRSRSASANDDQPRDAQGRFTDDDSDGGSRSASRDDDQPRDAQGRFTDDDDRTGGSRSMSGQAGSRSDGAGRKSSH